MAKLNQWNPRQIEKLISKEECFRKSRNPKKLIVRIPNNLPTFGKGPGWKSHCEKRTEKVKHLKLIQVREIRMSLMVCLQLQLHLIRLFADSDNKPKPN
jgi:hypothetical protein